MPPISKVVEGKPAVPTVNLLLFFVVSVSGCALDLVTKQWVFSWRGMPPQVGPRSIWWLWEGYVGIETATNSGALFGMGQGFSWFFCLLSFFAACGILYWLFLAGAIRDRLLTTSLSAITAGIGGNLFDRLGLWDVPGNAQLRLTHVRDWILFQYGEYVWPNFNIADCFLVVGAALMVWHSFRETGGRTGTKETDNSASEALLDS